MHELSLAQDLVEKILAIIKRENVKKVLSITVSIGALSGVEQNPMEFCFPEATRNTPLEGCGFHITKQGLIVSCKDCNEISKPSIHAIFCSHCQSGNVDIVEGKDFKLMELEVDV